MRHEVLHASEVAEPFLPYRPHEGHAAGGLDPRFVQSSNHAKDDGQPAAVVRNAGSRDSRTRTRRLDVGPLRKNGVEVRAHHDARPGGAARPLSDDVSDRIDSDVLQPEPLEGRTIGLGAQPLGERRRRDFAQASLFVQNLRLVDPDEVERGANRGLGRERLSRRCRQLHRGCGSSDDGDDGERSEG